MSSRKISPFWKSLSGRLAISYFLFFAFSSVLMFGVLLYSVSQFLQQKDRDLIEARLQQYQEILYKEGVPGIEAMLKESRLRSQSARFLIVVRDSTQKFTLLHLPEEMGPVSLSEIQKIVSQRTLAKSSAWFYIPSTDGDEDALEVRESPIENNLTLFVGASSDSRDEILEHILKIFMMLLVPLLAIAAIGAFYIAKRSLSPVRQLIATATKIKDGDLSSRVPVRESHDELYQLSFLFNEMIARVEGLVVAMKETLDNIAHDLKTPITRLKISGELALRSKDPAQEHMALIEAIENCDEIQNLVKTVMAVSEISTKTANFEMIEFDFVALIKEVVDVYFFVAEDKFIKIQIPALRTCLIRGDRGALKQAIANLLDNALKYSPEHTEIRFDLRFASDSIVLVLQDQGIGISTEDLPRIWERLYRGDKSRHEPGLGLGLSLVRAIVEAHGGYIQVESYLGKGSVFEVSLPHLD